MIRDAEIKDVKGVYQDTVPLEPTLSRAEFHLHKLAEVSKKRRYWNGTVLLMGGSTMMIVGGKMAKATTADSENNPIAAAVGGAISGIPVLTGALIDILGLIEFIRLSRTEKESMRIGRISDSESREKASHQSLHALADRAKKRRYYNAAFEGYLGLSVLREPDLQPVGILFLLFSGYSLYFKSLEELTLERYLWDIDKSKLKKDLIIP